MQIWLFQQKFNTKMIVQETYKKLQFSAVALINHFLSFLGAYKPYSKKVVKARSIDNGTCQVWCPSREKNIYMYIYVCILYISIWHNINNFEERHRYIQIFSSDIKRCQLYFRSLLAKSDNFDCNQMKI